MWHHDQLRAHHGCAESDWKHLPEYCCQHRWPSWEYHLSFSNCSYQQCRHQVRQRQDLYHAVATSCVCLFRRARRSRVTAGRRTEKQSHASAASKRSPGLRRHLCKKIDELLSLKSFLRVYVASLAPKQRCSGRRAARNFPKAADTAASTVIQSTRHC